ncbi:MAG: hypothetical protein ACYCYM_01355 [Saccharofermentanales bacterium]
MKISSRVFLLAVAVLLLLTGCGASTYDFEALKNTKWVNIEPGKAELIYYFNGDASEFIREDQIPIHKIYRRNFIQSDLKWVEECLLLSACL